MAHRTPTTQPPDVFSAHELARVTGLPVRQVRALIHSAAIPTIDGALVARHDAVRVCRALLDGRMSTNASGSGIGLFSRGRNASTRTGRSTGMSLVVSGSVHAGLLALVLVLATVAVPRALPDEEPAPQTDLVHLVFIAEPGPGGGGGGGGRRQPEPPPAAKRAGTRTVSSPLPRRQPPKLAPPRPQPVRPPQPLPREPLPPLLAPLVAVGTDRTDVAGQLAQAMTPLPPLPETPSRGRGTGGGIGSGAGVGVGAGSGRGVGPGEGGGAGGGPYRPGSGVEPPGLLHEVAPSYTEQARRAGLEGEVLLEIVVGPDGEVSDIRVVRRLGGGLDDRAVAAVRQWRFSPARRLGAPVAVIVEVAVEFTLR